MSGGFKKDPSATISESAVIGTGVRIWQNCVVMGGARIGDHTQLSANVFVEGKVTLGRNVKVKNNVSLYDGVVLEDDVFVGPSAVFTNVVTPRSAWPRKNDFRETRVGHGATIGANATIVCGVQIGVYALIGAGAVVTRDVPDFALVVGNPARQTGWVCQCGTKLRGMVKALSETVVCPVCDSRYEASGRSLTSVHLSEPKPL